jgi:hypothetical protein
MMVYIVSYIPGLPSVSDTIHLHILFTMISVLNIEIIILGCISTGHVTTSHAQVLPDNSLFTDGLFNLEYRKLQLTL